MKISLWSSLSVLGLGLTLVLAGGCAPHGYYDGRPRPYYSGQPDIYHHYGYGYYHPRVRTVAPRPRPAARPPKPPPAGTTGIVAKTAPAGIFRGAAPQTRPGRAKAPQSRPA